jgi:hypothetical protein
MQHFGAALANSLIPTHVINLYLVAGSNPAEAMDF